MRIAIDPGSSGGLTAEFPNGEIRATPMPDNDTDIVAWFKTVREDAKLIDPNVTINVMMEKVGGFIGTRQVPKTMPCPICHNTIRYFEKQGDPASAMFNFGDGNGFIRGLCIALGFRYETVTPRVWQASLGLHKDKGMGKTEWMNVLKDRAQKLFPAIRCTHKTSAALLIMEYSRRVRSNYTPAPAITF